MIFSRKIKGQSSIEFILIAGVMVLIFLGMVLVIQSRMSSIRNSNVFNLLDELGNIVISETNLANSAQDYYYREFYLPQDIKSLTYDINITANSEITIRTLDSDYVIFLNTNISGSIGPGMNSIIKKNGEINISRV